MTIAEKRGKFYILNKHWALIRKNLDGSLIQIPTAITTGHVMERISTQARSLRVLYVTLMINKPKTAEALGVGYVETWTQW